MATVEHESLYVTLTDDGIIVGRSLRPDLQLSAEAVNEIMEVLRTIAGGELRRGLWNSSDMPPPLPEGWNAFIEAIPTIFSALAVVVSPASQAYLAPYAPAIGSLLMPFRIFEDEETAMEWLQTEP